MEHLEIYYNSNNQSFWKLVHPDHEPMNMGTWQSKHDDVNIINVLLEPYGITAEEIKSETPFGSIIIGFKLTGDASGLTYFKLKYM